MSMKGKVLVIRKVSRCERKRRPVAVQQILGLATPKNDLAPREHSIRLIRGFYLEPSNGSSIFCPKEDRVRIGMHKSKLSTLGGLSASHQKPSGHDVSSVSYGFKHFCFHCGKSLGPVGSN
jgi:hypothetical protein